MWQRIQTLYFILILILMSVAILVPSVHFFNLEKQTHFMLDSRGVLLLNSEGIAEKTFTTNPCTYLYGILLFLTTYIIFQYKNRKKQFRLATLNFILIFAYIVIYFVFVIYTKGKLNVDLELKYPSVLPIIALILNYLGMRGISKDEKLVRSLDRLR
jgi:membrane-associated HD superfamily phosphohydrolase